MQGDEVAVADTEFVSTAKVVVGVDVEHELHLCTGRQIPSLYNDTLLKPYSNRNQHDRLHKGEKPFNNKGMPRMFFWLIQ